MSTRLLDQHVEDYFYAKFHYTITNMQLVNVKMYFVVLLDFEGLSNFIRIFILMYKKMALERQLI